MLMPEAVIVEAVRTPTGRKNGSLSGWHPVALGAGISPALIEDVVMGCVTQTSEQGGNIGRLAALHAGFPVDVPGVSLNRMCGSSQQAIHFASQAIAAGDMEVVIAAGVEHMSRVKMGSDWGWDQTPPGFGYDLIPQGLSAELMAETWNLPRTALDQYAYESHLKAAAATKAGHFEHETLPIEVRPLEDKANGGNGLLTYDEGIRFEPDLEKMASLSPVFKEDGVVTAGNSSQISDGAAALLLTTPEKAAELGLRPRARIVSRVVVGSDPVLMLAGPIPATEKVLAKAGLTIGDIDVIEINEAFASVVVAWAHEIEPPMERVNPNGGAIALGHPLGATGAKLMTSLLHELERIEGRYGLQTMCIGHGMATATLIERLN
jgi:acetyl-CoA acetyltransferase family protein